MGLCNSIMHRDGCRQGGAADMKVSALTNGQWWWRISGFSLCNVNYSTRKKSLSHIEEAPDEEAIVPVQKATCFP